MNTNINQPPAPLNVNRKIITVLPLIGLVCAVLIGFVFLITQPIIIQNKIHALEQAIFKILPHANYKITYEVNDLNRFEQQLKTPSSVPTKMSETGQVVHAAYDNNQKLIGVVIAAQGMGYQDNIELLYAYQPDIQKIVGLAILASRETPGLGSKIITDPHFLENFKQLDASLNADNSSLLHDIAVVKPGKKQHAWQIDGITGATISSKAVGKIIQKSAADWIPLIKQNQQDFKLGKAIRKN